MADTWFTSDFHLGHFNIIRYCNRPFADTQEMNEAIIERMNASVKPNDVLYFLGDFCMGGPKAVALYRNQIACKTIHFIDGNHDGTTRKVQHLFTSWSSLSEIRVGMFPYRAANGMRRYSPTTYRSWHRRWVMMCRTRAHISRSKRYPLLNRRSAHHQSIRWSKVWDMG